MSLCVSFLLSVAAFRGIDQAGHQGQTLIQSSGTQTLLAAISISQ